MRVCAKWGGGLIWKLLPSVGCQNQTLISIVCLLTCSPLGVKAFAAELSWTVGDGSRDWLEVKFSPFDLSSFSSKCNLQTN